MITSNLCKVTRAKQQISVTLFAVKYVIIPGDNYSSTLRNTLSYSKELSSTDV